MKILQSLFLLTLVSIGAFVCAIGQTPKLIESSENPNCEGLLRDLDIGSLDVMSDPTAPLGYVVLSPGPNPIQNHQYEKYIRMYLAGRNLQARITFQVGEPKPKPTIEFWKVQSGVSAQFKLRSLSRDLTSKTQPILFDSELYETFVKNQKRTFVGSSCAACCISAMDWYLLAEFLDVNPSLKAYLVIRGPRERHRPLQRQLHAEINEAGIPKSRIRFLFSNKKLVNTNHFSEVAVFLSDRVLKSARSLRSDLEEDN